MSGVKMFTELVLVCNTCLANGAGVVKSREVINCETCGTPMKEMGQIWHRDEPVADHTGETENNY